MRRTHAGVEIDNLETLDWYPKPFGPGDIDGSGASRLLGAPNMGLYELFVREMAQNSWDAGRGALNTSFSINLRKLSSSQIRLLRSDVFANSDKSLGLSSLLSKREVWVIEVTDRGTSGLNGSVRSDITIPDGQPRNFVDLIFKIGAPKDTNLGAGTYGFGKTISYLISSVGTVLIWTQCRTGSGSYEHRIIGSAVGSSFDMDGVRYTGRQWWGRRVRNRTQIEPVIGRKAQVLGEAIFEDHFGTEETGTNILVIGPDFGEEDADGFNPTDAVKHLSDSVVDSLWPKLLDDQTGRRRMEISVRLDGVPQRLPRLQEDSYYSGYADCLIALRRTQAGLPVPPFKYPVIVEEIRSLRPARLLGHLALTRYPAHARHNASHAVALMRHDAELLVKYLEFEPLPVQGFQWAGVFKPVAETDDSFAKAEPPAHDEWNPETVKDKGMRRDVNIALRRIQEKVREYLHPAADVHRGDGPSPSVAHVGDMLADLIDGLAGGGGPTLNSRKPRASRSKPSSRKGKSRRNPEIVATRIRPAGLAGWVMTEVDVQLPDTRNMDGFVTVDLHVGIDGGSMVDESVLRPLGWVGEQEGVVAVDAQSFTKGQTRTFVFEAAEDVAADLDVRILDTRDE